ncbi:MAG: thiamine diphosphokinase [Aquamicrobium sp.]|nr:thiamine diphosphokinase [Aquamicrobium sp.]
MNRFLILLGGDLVRTPRLDAQAAGARVIAADSGIRHAHTLGVEPELWVGDFDSAGSSLEAAFAGVPREVFPAGKDKTDGELAVDAALSRGATDLVLAGAFGGPRADHGHLNLVLALRLAEGGRSVLLTSGAQEGVPLLPGKSLFDYAPGTLFSVLGFSELTGLSIAGALWPLDDVIVPFGSSLTISNAVESDLTIDLGAGRALLLAHPFPDPNAF